MPAGQRRYWRRRSGTNKRCNGSDEHYTALTTQKSTALTRPQHHHCPCYVIVVVVIIIIIIVIVIIITRLERNIAEMVI